MTFSWDIDFEADQKIDQCLFISNTYLAASYSIHKPGSLHGQLIAYDASSRAKHVLRDSVDVRCFKSATFAPDNMGVARVITRHSGHHDVPHHTRPTILSIAEGAGDDAYVAHESGPNMHELVTIGNDLIAVAYWKQTTDASKLLLRVLMWETRADETGQLHLFEPSKWQPLTLTAFPYGTPTNQDVMYIRTDVSDDEIKRDTSRMEFSPLEGIMAVHDGVLYTAANEFRPIWSYKLPENRDDIKAPEYFVPKIPTPGSTVDRIYATDQTLYVVSFSRGGQDQGSIHYLDEQKQWQALTLEQGQYMSGSPSNRLYWTKFRAEGEYFVIICEDTISWHVASSTGNSLGLTTIQKALADAHVRRDAEGQDILYGIPRDGKQTTILTCVLNPPPSLQPRHGNSDVPNWIAKVVTNKSSYFEGTAQLELRGAGNSQGRADLDSKNYQARSTVLQPFHFPDVDLERVALLVDYHWTDFWWYIDEIELKHITSGKAWEYSAKSTKVMRERDNYSLWQLSKITYPPPKGTGSATIYIWSTAWGAAKNSARLFSDERQRFSPDRQSLRSGWGHAAMLCDNGTYVSFWPSSPGKPLWKGAWSKDKQEDIGKEGGRQPDYVLTVDGLRTDLIKTYIDRLKTIQPPYNAFNQNCATMVWYSMIEGAQADEKTRTRWIAETGKLGKSWADKIAGGGYSWLGNLTSTPWSPGDILMVIFKMYEEGFAPKS